MKIFVVTYSHRDCVDVWLAWTREKAVALAVYIADDYLSELDPDDAEKVQAHIDAGRFQDALDDFEAFHPQEDSFTVVEEILPQPC